MKKILKIVISLALAVIMATAAFADFIPYPSYTLDTKLRAMPTAPGYLPGRVVGGKMTTDVQFKNPKDLYLYGDILFVADTGNRRVVALDVKNDYSLIYEITEFAGKTFANPTGLCVANEKLYVADRDAGSVEIFNIADGSYIKSIGAPDLSLSALQSIEYHPTKVGVDSNGRIFVVCEGMTDGLIQIDENAKFIRYFGSNAVTPNLAELFLRKFMTTEQIKKRVINIPIEYNNIAIDNEDFVYVTTDNVIRLQIKRLNALGGNIMSVTGRTKGVYGQTDGYAVHMQDVSSDNYNNVYGVTLSGVIYQYNELGDVLNIFGGSGTTVGTFSSPSAIHVTGDGKTIYVLDSQKASITVFEATEFGELVLEANNSFVEGRYEDSLELWAQVIRLNGNYDVAYTGIGNAYMQMKDYELAMKNFKLGENKTGYSKAFKEQRSKDMNANFSWIMSGIVVLIVLLFVLRKKIGKLFDKIKGFVNA